MKGENVFLGLQIFFAVMTFAGFVLLLMQVVDNAGMSVVSMTFSLMSGNIYRRCRNKREPA